MIKAPLTDSQPHLGTLQLPYGHPPQDTKAGIPTLMESYVEFPLCRVPGFLSGHSFGEADVGNGLCVSPCTPCVALSTSSTGQWQVGLFMPSPF